MFFMVAVMAQCMQLIIIIIKTTPKLKMADSLKNYKFEGIQENFWGNLGQNGLKTQF